MRLDRLFWLLIVLGFVSPVKAGELVLAPRVRITELMYHPPGGDAHEYIELKNLEATEVDASGWSFSGISYVFPPSTKLSAGQIVVLGSSANPGSFAQKYPGVAVFGQFGGKLANGGERIVLSDAVGHVITSVDYKDSGFWPTGADGTGSSLEVVNPSGDAGDPANWRASSVVDGTPGTLSAFAPPLVRINEVLADNFAAVTHLGATPDFVELINNGTTSADLSNWSISDHQSEPRRFVLPPGTLLQPGGYLVIWMDNLAVNNELHSGFGLEKSAGTMAIFDVNTNRVDCFSYGPQVTDFSVARFGEDWALAKPTPGEANERAALGSPASLVINEWYADSLSGEPDWIELYNKDPNLPVSLGGLFIGTADYSYQITSQSFIGPAGFAQLIGGTAPEANHILLKFPSTGGKILLADASQQIIDRIDYGQQSDGQSQGRLPDGSSTFVFFSTAATPGGSNVGDDDGDGIPNWWELAHGLNPKSAADALLDADGDGQNNLNEYLAGTDPQASTSVLKLTAARAGNQVSLSFDAMPNKHYILRARPGVASGRWTTITDVPETNAFRIITTSESVSQTSTRFYSILVGQTSVPASLSIVSATPLAGASNVSQASGIIVDFNQGVDPATLTTNNFRLTDDLGRPAAGHVRFYASFTRAIFQPDLPLDGLTAYQVSISTDVHTATGTALDKAATWSFTTTPAARLVEDKTVYTLSPSELPDAHITPVERPGGYTMGDVYNDTNASDDFNPEVEVILQASDFAQTATIPNGLISQRGQSTRHTGQKSYKVSLYSNSPAWEGFWTLNFNKHAYDLTRLRNKLSFDYISLLPDMTSLRTAFAHVYIKTNSTDVDYGLFTHVENPDKDFLKAHGLDPKGQLYKAHYFEFYRYGDYLKLATDPAYNEKDFSFILEIKGSNDHRKLLKMLDDLNNSDIPSDLIFQKYFSRENYIVWLAMNILMENLDTNSQNFYLYSPSDSSTWYILPWDYDGAWDFYGQPNEAAAHPGYERVREGVANWWNPPLHKRFLSEPRNLEDLITKVNDLAANVFTPQHTAELLGQYTNIVARYAFQPPDIDELPVATGDAKSEWGAEVERLKTIPAQNQLLFLNTLNRPMPFFLADPENRAGGTYFNWDNAVQLSGHPVTYDFEVSSTPNFAPADLVIQKTGLTDDDHPLITAQPLPVGTYYYRVIARDSTDPQNNWQVAFDQYYDEQADKTYFGMKQFVLQ